MFNCEICKYNSNRKQNLERHLVSKKHINMSKIVKIKKESQNEEKTSKKYLEIFNDNVFYKIILGKKELKNTSNSQDIINIAFTHNTISSLDINIMISNLDNTNMKVENYTCNLVFNKDKNIKHANIHQINTFQSEICDNNTSFIKDFSTNIEPNFVYNTNLLLTYRYNIDKSKTEIPLFINYNIKLLGNNYVKII